MASACGTGERCRADSVTTAACGRECSGGSECGEGPRVVNSETPEEACTQPGLWLVVVTHYLPSICRKTVITKLSSV